MKTLHLMAARAAILTAIILSITACSTLPEPEPDQPWKPPSTCPLDSGFFGNQADSECLFKEQQNTPHGYTV